MKLKFGATAYVYYINNHKISTEKIKKVYHTTVVRDLYIFSIIIIF